ncbi:helix-turn-helix domain-containing protein [Erythrobacter mangrovi]|uniref:Helix-turn-helix domain-containing protein n=1 Tax=Erythrobacter mangrovi TaxID=2739433 RepID=A0A7D3XBB3_9SPHN|nr:helix-turn-helix domain-containing protein [Erythrobacter mangrovi]QKG71120.1 helix-turn-helix domain-containing protein [Erythrobacter mangrovi]
MQGRLEVEAEGPSQRGEPRRRLFLSGSVTQTGSTCEVRVHNLSATGMLLSTDGHFDLDEPLLIVFGEAGERLARIVWSADGLFGCRFDESLTKAQMSAILLRSEPVPSEEVIESMQAARDEGFGARLKRLRKTTGLSMVDFASQFGVTKPTLWKWETERARPRRAVLRDLAAYFGLTEQELLYGSNGVAKQPSDTPADAAADHLTGSLSEIVARSRSAIAREAGVPIKQVSIAIDWN